MAEAFSEQKLWGGQCFRAFAAESWRDVAHGRTPKPGVWRRETAVAGRGRAIWEKAGRRDAAHFWRKRGAAFGRRPGRRGKAGGRGGKPGNAGRGGAAFEGANGEKANGGGGFGGAGAIWAGSPAAAELSKNNNNGWAS
jgi:hypothetical protein